MQLNDTPFQTLDYDQPLAINSVFLVIPLTEGSALDCPNGHTLHSLTLSFKTLQKLHFLHQEPISSFQETTLYNLFSVTTTSSCCSGSANILAVAEWSRCGVSQDSCKAWFGASRPGAGSTERYFKKWSCFGDTKEAVDKPRCSRCFWDRECVRWSEALGIRRSFLDKREVKGGFDLEALFGCPSRKY